MKITQPKNFTLSSPVLDPRILTRAQVRAMLQLLHPDKYGGTNPKLAEQMFHFFKTYEGRDELQ